MRVTCEDSGQPGCERQHPRRARARHPDAYAETVAVVRCIIVMYVIQRMK